MLFNWFRRKTPPTVEVVVLITDSEKYRAVQGIHEFHVLPREGERVWLYDPDAKEMCLYIVLSVNHHPVGNPGGGFIGLHLESTPKE